MNIFAIFAAVVAGFAGYVVGEHNRRGKKPTSPVSGRNAQLPTFTNGSPVGVPGYSPTLAANRPDQVYAAHWAGPDSVTEGSANYQPAFGPDENMPATEQESFS